VHSNGLGVLLASRLGESSVRVSLAETLFQAFVLLKTFLLFGTFVPRVVCDVFSLVESR